jgi:hypothetical protein
MKPLNPDNLGILRTGEFYVYGWNSKPTPYKIEEKRLTRDGGKTILLQPIQRKTGEQLTVSEFRKMVLERLKKVGEEKGEVAILKAKLTSLTNQNEQLQRKADVAEVIRESLQQPGPKTTIGAVSLSADVMAKLDNLGTLEADKKSLQGRIQNYEQRLRAFEDARKGLQYLLSPEIPLLTPAEKFESVAGPADPMKPPVNETEAVWLSKLHDAPRKLLQYLIVHKGIKYTKSELAAHTGYVASGGGFREAVRILERNGLIKIRGQEVSLI